MPAVVAAAATVFSSVTAAVSSAALTAQMWATSALISAGISTGAAIAITNAGAAIIGTAALNAGINALAPKPKVSMAAQMQAAIGAISPTYMIAGRTITAGVSMVENMVSGKNNDIASYIVTLAHTGETGTVDAVKWGDDILTFDGIGNCISPAKYAGACVLMQRSGAWAQSAMQIASINGFIPAYDQPSDWTATHRALGCLTAWLVVRTWYDCWKNNSNQPQFICSANIIELYDPRTQAPCTTWAQRQNPGCWSYSWAKKWLSPTGITIAGIGWTDAQIDLVTLSYWANICDNNAWKISAIIDCDPANKSEVMTAICQAGAAAPTYRGGKFSVFYAAPRTSVVTLTEDDFCAKPKRQSSVPFTYRPNRIIPRFISESSNWTIVDGAVVTSASYVTSDGGDYKTEPMEFPYAGGGDTHVGQLAAYALANAREPFKDTCFLKPQARYKFAMGDCITINAPTYGYNNYKCLVTKRDFAADFTSQIEAVTETDAKHPFALGQSTTPPDFSAQMRITGGYCPTPLTGAWTATATQMTSGGTSLPIIRVTGASDYNLASAVIIRYRLNAGSSPWLGMIELPQTATQAEIDSVTPNTSYIIGISYKNQFGVEGAIIELDPVTTGTYIAGAAATAPWGGITSIPPNLAELDGTEPIRNSLISLGSLGFTGDPAATKNNTTFGTTAAGPSANPTMGGNGDFYIESDAAKRVWMKSGGSWAVNYDAKTNIDTLASTFNAASSANENVNVTLDGWTQSTAYSGGASLASGGWNATKSSWSATASQVYAGAKKTIPYNGNDILKIEVAGEYIANPNASTDVRFYLMLQMFNSSNVYTSYDALSIDTGLVAAGFGVKSAVFMLTGDSTKAKSGTWQITNGAYKYVAADGTLGVVYDAAFHSAASFRICPYFYSPVAITAAVSMARATNVDDIARNYLTTSTATATYLKLTDAASTYATASALTTLTGRVGTAESNITSLNSVRVDQTGGQAIVDARADNRITATFGGSMSGYKSIIDAAVSTNAAQATSISQLSAKYKIAGNLIKNPTFALGLTNWVKYGGLTGTAAKFTNGYGVRVNGQAAGTQFAYYQDFTAAPSTAYSLQAKIFANLPAGTNARVYIQWLNSSGIGIGYTAAISRNDTTWETSLLENQISPSTTARALLWIDIVGGGAITDVIWQYIKVEANATCSVYTDDNSAADLSASVTTAQGAIAAIQGAAAYYNLEVAASGSAPALMSAKAGAGGSSFDFISKVFRIWNSTSTGVIEVLKAVGGYVFFSNPISIDVGAKRLTLGANASHVLWFGANTIDPPSQTLANSTFALGADGKVYYAASVLVSGQLSLSMVANISASGASNVTTSNVTVTPNGGSTYTYLWANVAGDSTISISSTNSGTVYWTGTVTAGQTKVSTWQVEVGDEFGRKTTRLIRVMLSSTA